jgi:hypothetical protein
MVVIYDDRITVFLADDNVIVREGVRALLSVELAFEIVGVAGDYDSLMADGRRRSGRSPMLVTDIPMPPSFQSEGIDAMGAVTTVTTAPTPATTRCEHAGAANDERSNPIARKAVTSSSRTDTDLLSACATKISPATAIVRVRSISAVRSTSRVVSTQQRPARPSRECQHPIESHLVLGPRAETPRSLPGSLEVTGPPIDGVQLTIGSTLESSETSSTPP